MVKNMDKKSLKERFGKEWEKHYKLNVLIEKGFKRQRCKRCGTYFWSILDRELCGDPSCIGYQFIGNPPKARNLSYVETWKEIENYFVKTGHTSIKPFPTVARWREDLYFTLASINDFQPYVVNGEIEPIANPLIVPQPCIRFNDIDNVGVTGRHYTNFVMIGQHAFNTPKTGLFYWKEEAISHDIGYLTALGIPLEEIIFHEDVWVGGGNFGPSMEYFVRGLELGNCVFMQYEITPNGERELKTKVIDMGAGLNRFTWLLSKSPTSYEVVFGKAIEYLKKENAVDYDEELFLEYAKLSGALNLDEAEDIESLKREIFRKLGVEEEEFNRMFKPLQSLYAIADHSLTLLFTIKDGMMPSNSGGGYNLRTIARRMFNFIDKYNFSVDWNKLLDYHMENLRGLFDEYREGIEVVVEVINEERRKYEKQKQNAKKRVARLVKSKKSISLEDLILLYKSEGIMPEHLKEEAKKFGINIKIPENFYNLVREKEEKTLKKEKPLIDVSNYPKTEKLYYLSPPPKEFEATVLGVEESFVILDKTAFYPEGGGQVGDTGYLGNIRVLDTQKVNDVVLHKVSNPEKFKKGEKVFGKVDWERRLHISRHHTVTHIITAVAREVIGKHVWQAGAKKEEDKAHIDLTHYKRITQEQIDEIERKVNNYIIQNLPIIIEELPRNKAEEKYGFTIYQGGAVPGKIIRIVKVGEIDAEACGGTHNVFERTGEIGYLKIIKRQGIKDGVERLVYKAGLKAVDYVQKREELLRSTSEVFSVSQQDLPKTAKRFFEEWKEQRAKLKELYNAFALKELENAEKVGKFLIVFSPFKGVSDVLMREKNIIIVDFEDKLVRIKFSPENSEKDSVVKKLNRFKAKIGKNMIILPFSSLEKEIPLENLEREKAKKQLLKLFRGIL